MITLNSLRSRKAMAKNRWYAPKEDAHIKRRIRELRINQLPYGRRTAAYQQIARELYARFAIRRTWQGVQQRARIITGAPGDE